MKSDKRIPFFLITRHLVRCNKWTLLLIVFLMAIAFINLVFINSLFNGVIESNNEQLINTKTGNIMIVPTRGQDFIGNADETVRKVERARGVKDAAPETELKSSLEFNLAKGDYTTTAIDPVQEERVTTVSRKMSEGSYLKPGDREGIIIGQEVAGQENKKTQPLSFGHVRVGDTLTVVVGNDRLDFKVRGVFDTKFSGTDDRAFITREGLERIAPRTGGMATDIIVKIRKTGNEQVVIGQLKALGVEGIYFTWQQAAGRLASVTDSFVTINALLTVVGYFIAAVTIFIIMYVDITHKRQEIGILRAVGVKSYLIGTTFVLQTIVYSFLGVALGTAMYFGIIFPYFQAYPFRIPIGDVTLSVSPADFVTRSLAVVLVAILSGLIPAIIGLRTKILDAILGR
jgi:putative ABC transport system permease protein